MYQIKYTSGFELQVARGGRPSRIVRNGRIVQEGREAQLRQWLRDRACRACRQA